MSQRKLAAALEVNRTTIVRWARHGLSFWAADRAAAKLGMHMLEIWPEAGLD